MKRIKLLLVTLIFLMTACAPQATPAPAEPQTLTIMTHDSFAVSEDVVKSFEHANNAKRFRPLILPRH